MPFNMDAGVKSLYETVTTILRSDATLKSLVSYDSKNPNIRRGFQTEGSWKILVVFYFQPEIVFTDVDARLRKVPLILQLYSKENDLILYDIGERIIELLDEAQGELTKVGKVFVFDSAYDSEIVALNKDVEKQSFNRALRFMITFRKEGD